MNHDVKIMISGKIMAGFNVINFGIIFTSKNGDLMGTHY
jgi:hypothetical protein